MPYRSLREGRRQAAASAWRGGLTTCSSWKQVRIGDQVDRQAVGEIALLRVSPDVLEWHDDHHGTALGGGVMAVLMSPRSCHRGGPCRDGGRPGGHHGFQPQYRTGKQIAAPCHGAQRLLPRIVEGAADLSNTLRDAVFGDEGLRPDRLHDFVAVDQPIGVFNHVTQQSEGFRAQCAFCCVLQQNAATKVQHKPAECVAR